MGKKHHEGRNRAATEIILPFLLLLRVRVLLQLSYEEGGDQPHFGKLCLPNLQPSYWPHGVLLLSRYN